MLNYLLDRTCIYRSRVWLTQLHDLGGALEQDIEISVMEVSWCLFSFLCALSTFMCVLLCFPSHLVPWEVAQSGLNRQVSGAWFGWSHEKPKDDTRGKKERESGHLCCWPPHQKYWWLCPGSELLQFSAYWLGRYLWAPDGNLSWKDWWEFLEDKGGYSFKGVLYMLFPNLCGSQVATTSTWGPWQLYSPRGEKKV